MTRHIKLKPEDLLHKEFCDYLLLQYPGIEIHHSPNEGKRNWFAQYLMTILHVSRGFPDLFLVYKDKAIAIEVKAVKLTISKSTGRASVRPTSKPSKEQLAWVQRLNRANIPAAVCTGIDECVRFADHHYFQLKLKS